MLQLFLQSLFLIGIVSVAEESGDSKPLCLILYDVDSAKGNHAAEIGGVLGGPDLILVKYGSGDSLTHSGVSYGIIQRINEKVGQRVP